MRESLIFLPTTRCRYGGSQLHTLAATFGGIAAQEATKLITRQYVPLDNTFVLNGITASGASFIA